MKMLVVSNRRQEGWMRMEKPCRKDVKYEYNTVMITSTAKDGVSYFTEEKSTGSIREFATQISAVRASVSFRYIQYEINVYVCTFTTVNGSAEHVR